VSEIQPENWRRYHLTEAIASTATRQVLWRLRLRPMALFYQFGILAGLAILFVAGGIVWLIIPVALIIALGIVLQVWLAGRAASRNFHRSSVLQAEFEVAWSDEAYFARSEFGQTRIPWTNFFGWLDVTGMLLIYTQPGVHLILPDAAFSDAERQAIIDHLIAAGVTPVPKRRREFR